MSKPIKYNERSRRGIWMSDKPRFAELLQRLRGRAKEKGTKTGKEGESETST
jgi:hypothetical protein